MRVLVIHGPNLNALGTREPEIYGSQTLAEVDAEVKDAAASIGAEVEFAQSQREGEIIEWLHDAAGRFDGVLLNPAAYSHTSRAIAEAVASITLPVIEVHISNIHARESWRRSSVTAAAARGVVTGFGAGSYVAALHALRHVLGR